MGNGNGNGGDTYARDTHRYIGSSERSHDRVIDAHPKQQQQQNLMKTTRDLHQMNKLSVEFLLLHIDQTT